jgi:hypothetical protein
MPRPIVEVLQKVANIQTTVTDPTQATLIVGPNYNIIDYDSTDSQTVRDLAKVDDFEPYADGSTGGTIDVVVDLSPRGAVHSDSINIYLEDAEYEVGTVSTDAVLNDYDGSAANYAAMLANQGTWSQKLKHATSFIDAAVKPTTAKDDKVVISYPLANVFVPGTAFSAAQLGFLGDSTTRVWITVVPTNSNDAPVYHDYRRPGGLLGGFASTHIDLFEIIAGEAVFSKIDGADALLIPNDTAATVKLIDSGDNDNVLATITGTLTTPADQTTYISVINTAGDEITVKDHLRQFVSSHLTVASNQGLLDALPFISANPNVYAILPLTQDLSVLSTYGTAAAAQSAPEVGKFRIVLGSAETAPLWRYWAGTRANEYGWAASNLASGTVTNAVKIAGADGTAVIQDPEGGFLSVGGPAVGDTVYFAYSTDLTVTLKCTVASIESNSSMTVNLPKATAVVVNNNSTISFTGASDIKDNRVAQVEDLVKAILPLTSNLEVAKRLVMVYPGEVSIGNEAGLPGYYLTAALGGMLAAFEPHRPKNQIAVAGIADIEYSNLGYFTEAQIDTLGDAGYFVFVQEIPGGLPYCVHQVTLGYKDYASTQEYSELSVVNNFDYVSSVFKNTLTPYVGVWNVIPQAYSSIMASLDSAILSLRSRSVDRIGSPLVSGNIVSVEPSEADAGTINVVMDVQLPKVLNKIRLEVVSQ